MRDTTMGIILGAAAIILATWYLRRTGGALAPAAGTFSLSSLLSPPPPDSGDCGCGCAPARGYQPSIVTAPAQPAPTVNGSN
jgi:hypothetical protein